MIQISESGAHFGRLGRTPILVGLAGLLVALCWSCSDVGEQLFPNSAKDRYEELCARVERQWGDASNHVDGIYARHAYNCLVISKGSFAFAALPAALRADNYTAGTVRFVDAALEFQPEQASLSFLASDPYLSLRWRRELYLVQRSDLIESCSFVNGAIDLAYAPFFSRELEDADSIARPVLPLEFEKYLQERPIHVQVKRVDASKASATRKIRITLARGSDEGFLPGMRLRLCGDPYLDLVIESSTENESVGLAPGYAARYFGERAACFSTGSGHYSTCEFRSERR